MSLAETTEELSRSPEAESSCDVALELYARTMAKRVLSIGLNCGSVRNVSLRDRVPCDGYDAAIFVMHDGAPSGSSLGDWKYWRDSLGEFALNGGTLVLLGFNTGIGPPGYPDTLFEEVLGLEVKTVRTTDDDVVPASDRFQELFDLMPHHRWAPECWFEDGSAAHDIIRLTPSRNSVGRWHRVGNGLVLLLPSLPTQPHWISEVEEFVSWVLNFRPHFEEQPPPWVADFHILNETELANEIAAKQREIETLQASMEDALKSRLELGRWKELIFATDSQLEAAVDRTFDLLGFKALPKKGDEDHRWDYNNVRVMGESKGKPSKQVGKVDARQIDDWVTSEVKRLEAAADAAGDDPENVPQPKGIIVGNAYRLLPLEDRGPTFTPNVVDWLKARSHCMVTGRQLLEIVEIVLTDPSRKEEFVSSLLTTEGLLEHPDICSALV